MTIESVSFTTSGYIHVYSPSGEFISRHRQVDEAREAALNHAINNQQALGSGNHDYIFVQPETRMSIRLLDSGIGNPGVGGDQEPPLAPAGVFLDAVGQTTITVNWSSNSEPDIQDYRIYMSSVGPFSNFALVGTVATPETSFIMSNLAHTTDYWFYVTARDNALNESLASLTVTASTLPPVSLGPYQVYPIVPGGIFDGSESLITNPLATWDVVSEDNLGGVFTYYDGGAYAFYRGAATGPATASFTWIIYDYDGQGSSDTAVRFQPIL